MMNLSNIRPNIRKAVFFAKKQLPDLVCDAVNLEGIHYTVPEVQTLLDGITVGGHKQSDQTITLNQARAWEYLFKSVDNSQFECSKKFACTLHAIAGKEEALEWGCFRSGAVNIAGTDYKPPKAQDLNQCWDRMLSELNLIDDIYDRAINCFLQMARNQFFYDVNKRMGRFMMNGILLSQGYPVINLPARKKEAFNHLMLDFYQSNQPQPMIDFMKNCIDQTVIEIMTEV